MAAPRPSARVMQGPTARLQKKAVCGAVTKALHKLAQEYQAPPQTVGWHSQESCIANIVALGIINVTNADGTLQLNCVQVVRMTAGSFIADVEFTGIPGISATKTAELSGANSSHPDSMLQGSSLASSFLAGDTTATAAAKSRSGQPAAVIGGAAGGAQAGTQAVFEQEHVAALDVSHTNMSEEDCCGVCAAHISKPVPPPDTDCASR